MTEDRRTPKLELRSVEPGYVTISARMPRPPFGEADFDIESLARRCIGSLIRQLRETGGDPGRVTHTRICVSRGAYGAVLAAVRDEALQQSRAVHSIFLLNEDAEDAFTAELDVAARAA